MEWNNTSSMHPLSFVCGYCNHKVASNKGFSSKAELSRQLAYVYICPHCTRPTYSHKGEQVPSAVPGNDVAHLPPDVGNLYSEARWAVSAGAHTASVLACRKLLMNIAVAKGAQPGLSFVSYVEYLEKSGYVPPDSRGWVDHIRIKGNEATHEIALMSAVDATELISFSEMLLKFIFEFPARIPKKSP